MNTRIRLGEVISDGICRPQISRGSIKTIDTRILKGKRPSHQKPLRLGVMSLRNDQVE